MRRTNGRRRRLVWPMAMLTILTAWTRFAAAEILRDLAVSPDGAHVYVARDAGPTTLVVYSRSPTGTLAGLQTLPPSACAPGLPGPPPLTSVAVSHDGLYVYATSKRVPAATGVHRPPVADGAVLVFARIADAAHPDFGKLTLQQVVTNGSLATDLVNGLASANAIVVSPDDANVYVAAGVGLQRLTQAGGSAERGAVVSFARGSDGNLTFIGELHGDLDQDGLADLSGANHLAISGDGHSVYAVGTDVDTLVHLRRDPSSGALALAQVLRSMQLRGVLTTPFEVSLAADGRFVYVAARGGSVSWYARRRTDARGAALDPLHPDFGKLTYQGQRKPTFAGASGLGVQSIVLSRDPAQAFAFVAAGVGGSGGVISVYGRNPATGALSLSPLQQVDDGNSSGALALAPAIAGMASDHLFGIALRLFRVNAYVTQSTSGRLTWVPPGYGEPTPVAYCTPSPTPPPTPSLTPTLKPTTTPTRTPAPSPHDSGIEPHPPVHLALRGAETLETHVFLSVRNLDAWETPPHLIRLEVADGSCPAGTVVGTPVFPASGTATIAVKGGVKRFARVELRLQRQAFAELPTTCELEMSGVTVGAAGAFDPDPSNDKAKLTLEIDP